MGAAAAAEAGVAAGAECCCHCTCFSLPRALLLVLLPLAIGAHYLENIFIVNHIQHGLVPPTAAHWSVKQVLGTSNWHSGSVWWNWVSGGLNHQIEHHLFPSMNIHLYPLIAPIVKQTCLEYGLPYYNYPSFGVAYLDMIRYLRAMGDPSFTADKFTSFLQLQQQQLEGTASRARASERPPVGKGVKVGAQRRVSTTAACPAPCPDLFVVLH